MREILFRGFHKDKNGTEKVLFNGKWHKGEWVEGCYFVAKDKNFNILHYISEIKGENMFEVFPETVGQYTGLTDRNGAKIFEGDIVKYKNYKGEYIVKPVKYDFEWNRFCVFINGVESMGINEHLSDDIVIVGNIYDNPELLVQE